MKYDKLYKGILIVLIANIFNLIFSLFNGFILPKFLTVEAYACIKTFNLYISYIGILHFGFADGVYLRYGGKKLKEINSEEIGKQRGTLLLAQFIETIILLIVAKLLDDNVFIMVALSIVPYNVTQYYKLLFQATGEFREYTSIINITFILTFIFNIVYLFVIREQEGLLYVLAYVLVYFAIWIYVEIRFNRKHIKSKLGVLNKPSTVELVTSGFPLMLGNFSSIILTSTDRWFVKLLMDTMAFAQYSFAVSIENLLNLLVTPISTTLYSFFCVQKNDKEYDRIHKIIIIFSTFIISAVFPVKFIVEKFISHYSDSIHVLFYLFAANVFLTIIKCFYINLYKAEKKQVKYFKGLVAVIIIGVLLNAGLYIGLKTKESLALATMLSSIIWFFICRYDFRHISMKISQYIYIILMLVAFFVFEQKVSSVMGFILYLFIWGVLSFIFNREALISALKIGFMQIYKRIKKA